MTQRWSSIAQDLSSHTVRGITEHTQWWKIVDNLDY